MHELLACGFDPSSHLVNERPELDADAFDLGDEGGTGLGRASLRPLQGLCIGVGLNEHAPTTLEGPRDRSLLTRAS